MNYLITVTSDCIKDKVSGIKSLRAAFGFGLKQSKMALESSGYPFGNGDVREPITLYLIVDSDKLAHYLMVNNDTYPNERIWDITEIMPKGTVYFDTTNYNPIIEPT